MTSTKDADTEELLNRTSAGDETARQQLLLRHRARLRKMVALRMDRRLLGRFDPSDIVQEVLAEAAEKLDGYIAERPLPYYPWLRQIADDHLVELHRRHVKAKKRAIGREERWDIALPNESALEL